MELWTINTKAQRPTTVNCTNENLNYNEPKMANICHLIPSITTYWVPCLCSHWYLISFNEPTIHFLLLAIDLSETKESDHSLGEVHCRGCWPLSMLDLAVEAQPINGKFRYWQLDQGCEGIHVCVLGRARGDAGKCDFICCS